MEDIKIYGHLISGISDDNSSYSNGDNWIAEAHDIYDEGFKNLSEEIVEGSLPIERQDQINRYLYSKVDDIQDKLNNYKLYSIVASLPTSNIDKNKMYIVASEEGVENNIYTEYIYTENNTWEKLGEFKADIDLTPHVKPIIFTLKQYDEWVDENNWNIIPEFGEEKKLTNEELQISNLIKLKDIGSNDNLNKSIIIKIEEDIFYVREIHITSLASSINKTIVVENTNENYKLKIRYNRSNKAGLVENYYISKYQIYPQVDHPSVGDSEYCLIKKQDYNDILRRLSALEGESAQTE